MTNWWDEYENDDGSPKTPENRGVFDRFKDAYMSGALHSQFGAAALVRGDLKRKGYSDNQINAVMRKMSDTYAARDAKDPAIKGNWDESLGRFAVDLAGNALGGVDPTYILGPGKTILQRIAAQAGINAAVDAGSQAIEVRRGIRDKYDPYETLINAGAGAAFQGAGEAAAKARLGYQIREGSTRYPAFKDLEKVMLNLEGGGTFAKPKTSKKGAMGPYQVMPETARDPGFHIRPWNGKTQEDLARVGRQYLAVLTHRYNGEHAKVLAAYNAGPGAVDRVIKKYGDDWLTHLPGETRQYVSDGISQLHPRQGKMIEAGDRNHYDPQERQMEEIEAKHGAFNKWTDDAIEQLQGIVDEIDQHGKSIDEFDRSQDNVTPINRTAETEAYDNLNEFLDELEADKTLTRQDIAEEINSLDLGRLLADFEKRGITPPDRLLKGIERLQSIYDSRGIDNIGYEKFTQYPREPEIIPTVAEVRERGIQLHQELTEGKIDSDEYFIRREQLRNLYEKAQVRQDNEPPVNLNDFKKVTEEGLDGSNVVDFSSPDLPPRRNILQLMKDLWNDESGALKGDDESEGSKSKIIRPSTGAMAGNINLEYLIAPADVIKSIRDSAAGMNVEPQTFEATKAKAEEMLNHHGVLNLLEMEKMRLDEIPAYETAIRAINVEAHRRFVELAKLVASDDGDNTINKVAFDQARLLRAAAYDKASGLAGHAGRILNARKIMIGKGALDKEALARITELTGNEVDPVKLAHLISMHDDAAATGQLASDSMRPKAEDYIFSAWYNFMLSNFTTHVANMAGTGSHMMIDYLSHVTGAIFGKLRGGDDRITGRELAARAKGAVEGVGVAKRTVPVAFRLGTPLDNKQRFETKSRLYYGKNPLQIIELATRGLAAEDEAFRAVAHQSGLQGLAERYSTKYGKTPEELIAMPPEEMLREVIDYAKTMRFADKPSEFTQKFERIKSSPSGDFIERGVAAGLKVIVPFMRVLDRLTASTVRHTPILGFLDKKNRADWMAGGARRDLVLGRMTVGTALLGTAILMASQNRLSGSGPSDRSKNAEKMGADWRPNSIKFGDKWYSYQTLQPISPLFSAAATYVEQMRETGYDKPGREETAVGKAMRTARKTFGALMTGNFLLNVTDFFGAANEKSGVSLDNWIAGLASSVTTPAVLRRFNQAYVDPVERDSTGDGSLEDRVVGRIKQGIPGLSDDLPARHDVFGEKQVREGSLGPDMISPLNVSTETSNAVIQEVERLSGNDKGSIVGPVGKNVRGRRLSAEEYQTYQALAGQMMVEDLAEVIFDPAYYELSDDEKRAKIQSVRDKARQNARDELFPKEEEGDDWWSSYE